MAVLPPVMTHVEAPACLEVLRQTVREQDGSVVVIDAQALTRFDSSALAVLLACRRDVQALGKRFVLRGLPPKLRQLAMLYGVSELLAEAA